MRRRPPRSVAEELKTVVDRAREAFLDTATAWMRLRQRFLIRIGKQPSEDPSRSAEDKDRK